MAAALLSLLLGPWVTAPAGATPPRGTCFALLAPSAAAPPSAVRCAGAPDRHARAALWLRLPLAPAPADRGVAVIVHATRVESLRAVFQFADGSRETQAVTRGDFGDRWHIGGQIAFTSGARQARLAAVWLRVEGLQGYGLLRVRLVPPEGLSRSFELCAALVGGALALLAVSALYIFGLAAAVRRRFFLWHGVWAASMLCWGLVWSQCALGLVPGIAGTTSSKLATILACLAILFATVSAVSALHGMLAAGLRRALVGAGIGVVALGGAADVPGADLAVIGAALAALTLAILAVVTASLIVACRRGSAEARDLMVAWIVPMLALGATQVFDFSTSLFGGGAQIAVLFASAFQTICLAALATRRLGRLRVERDAAIASRAALAELADRDALTGLLNRRGFVARCEQAFGGLRDVSFGLLLIDVDQFKSVNDRFGHETGDAVLVTLAGALRTLEQRHLCLAGRLGGEEFVIGISGMPAFALWRFAEHVREVLGGCDQGEVSRHQRVTVSIGVAEGLGSGPFHALYGKADRALYEAKRAGRDCVIFRPSAPLDPDQQLSLPLDTLAAGRARSGEGA